MTSRDAEQAQAEQLKSALRESQTLRRLARWTSPGGGLRGSSFPADEGQEREDHRDSAEQYIDVTGRHPDEQRFGWHSENQSVARPGERVSIYYRTTSWRRRPDGSLRRSENGFKVVKKMVPHGELVLSSPSSSLDAAALAYMTRGPHDIRPRLLLLWYGEDEGQVEAVLLYACAYLFHWDDRVNEANPRRKMRSAEVLIEAACDVISDMFIGRYGRTPRAVPAPAPALDERAATVAAIKELFFGRAAEPEKPERPSRYDLTRFSLDDRARPWASQNTVAEARRVCRNALERRLHEARLAYLHARHGEGERTSETLQYWVEGSKTPIPRPDAGPPQCRTPKAA